MKVVSLDPGSLTLDPENARVHGEENLDAIRESLERFGQRIPIVVDGDGVVRAGNGRVLAARALGWKKIFAVRVTDLSEDELRAFSIADNRTSELATWDSEVLARVLSELRGVEHRTRRRDGLLGRGGHGPRRDLRPQARTPARRRGPRGRARADRASRSAVDAGAWAAVRDDAEGPRLPVLRLRVRGLGGDRGAGDEWGFDVSADLRIEPASFRQIKHACETWHYSKCVPSGKRVAFAVYEDGTFRGVVVFSRGASPYLGRKWGLGPTEICELTRVAMRSHSTSVSRCVSICLRMLHRTNPGIDLVVSFADPYRGHIGGIYQAGNWIYFGVSAEVVEHFVRGRWRHRRGAWQHAKGKSFATRVQQGKHRYAYPLTERGRALAEEAAMPYPKKPRTESAGSAAGGASTVQVEGGGSIPTPALQPPLEKKKRAPRKRAAQLTATKGSR